MSAGVIFVFLDGVGLGPAQETNPFWRVPTPNLCRLLDGPLVNGRAVERPGLLLKAIDACLGVEGLPQSATGQTALFTGVNAARLLGRHLTAYPNNALKAVINEHNILKRATERGHRATFANAYSPQYFETVEQRRWRHSATTLSVLAAGLPFRTMLDLEQGHAVYWDITHRILNHYLGVPMPLIEPEAAGQRLARLADQHDLVLYESFLPDLVGHRRRGDTPAGVVDTLDRFLGGLLQAVAPTVTVVVSSDHGNLEDTERKTHTTNPVPLLAVGPGATRFRTVQAITDVADAIMDTLIDEDNPCEKVGQDRVH